MFVLQTLWCWPHEGRCVRFELIVGLRGVRIFGVCMVVAGFGRGFPVVVGCWSLGLNWSLVGVA